MKPYYEDGAVTLYHGDCREVLPALERESIDLLVTDPPYGVDWQSGWRPVAFPRLAGDDGLLPLHTILAAVLPSLRDFRHLYVFGLPDFSTLPIVGEAELIWDKGIVGMGDLTAPWGPQHERLRFGVYVPSRANRADGRGRLAARLRRGSILRIDRLHSGAVMRHPTEKPVPLLRLLIESSSQYGETVLDPFAGSGSTGVAAVLEGRRAVLIELEERYCEVAADRLRKVQPALALFEEALTG